MIKKIKAYVEKKKKERFEQLRDELYSMELQYEQEVADRQAEELRKQHGQERRADEQAERIAVKIVQKLSQNFNGSGTKAEQTASAQQKPDNKHPKQELQTSRDPSDPYILSTSLYR